MSKRQKFSTTTDSELVTHLEVYSEDEFKITTDSTEEMNNLKRSLGTTNDLIFKRPKLELVKGALPQKEVEYVEKIVSMIDLESTMTTASVSMPALPKVIIEKAKPYQIEGIKYCIQKKRALLADEMGLGKTVQAIAFAYASGGVVLVVCPGSLLANWKREIIKWTGSGGEDIQIINADKDVLKPDIRWYVASYGLAGGLKKAKYSEFLNKVKFTCLIADESHALITPTSQRSECLSKLAKKTDRVLLISGTPMSSKNVNLCIAFQILFPELKMTYDYFTKRYCNAHTDPFFGHWDVSGASKTFELRKIIQTRMIRREARVVLGELPKKTRRWVTLQIPETSLVEYKEVAQRRRALIEQFTRTKDEALGFQIAVIKPELYRTTCRAKTQAVTDFIKKDWNGEEKFLVFCNHEIMRDALECMGIDYLEISGQTPMEKRQSIVDGFLASKTKKMLILSITACCSGLNITPGVSKIYKAELTWTSSMHLQAEGRVHRFGCDRPVECIYLIAKGTFDDEMFKKLEDKFRAINETMGENNKLNMDSNTVGYFKGVEFEPYGISAPLARQIPDELKPLVKEGTNKAGVFTEVWEKPTEYINRVCEKTYFDSDLLGNRHPEYHDTNALNSNDNGEWINVLEYNEVDKKSIRFDNWIGKKKECFALRVDDEVLAVYVKRDSYK